MMYPNRVQWLILWTAFLLITLLLLSSPHYVIGDRMHIIGAKSAAHRQL